MHGPVTHNTCIVCECTCTVSSALLKVTGRIGRTVNESAPRVDGGGGTFGVKTEETEGGWVWGESPQNEIDGKPYTNDRGRKK